MIGAREIGLLGVNVVIVLRYMKGVYQGVRCILGSVFRSTCRDCTKLHESGVPRAHEIVLLAVHVYLHLVTCKGCTKGVGAHDIGLLRVLPCLYLVA